MRQFRWRFLVTNIFLFIHERIHAFVFFSVLGRFFLPYVVNDIEFISYDYDESMMEPSRRFMFVLLSLRFTFVWLNKNAIKKKDKRWHVRHVCVRCRGWLDQQIKHWIWNRQQLGEGVVTSDDDDVLRARFTIESIFNWIFSHISKR